MPRVRFVLQLDRVGVPGNAARMWLDTSRDDVLQSGEEVTLGTLDGKLWLAECPIQDATTGMQFLTKFIAPTDTRWSFSATSLDDDRVLYSVTDQQMATTKESLAGRLA